MLAFHLNAASDPAKYRPGFQAERGARAALWSFQHPFAAKLFARIRRRYPLRALIPEIRHGAQGVVEAIREIRRADHEREFDDLPLVKKLSQLREGTIAGRCGAPRDAFGVQNYGLVLLVE